MSTGLIEYQDNKATRYALVRDGIEGNFDVLWRMIDIVRETLILDKGFENFIKSMVVANGFDSYSDSTQLFTFLYNFVKHGNGIFDGVAYLQDIQGRTESIKDARTTLQDGFGDCDDNAILTASILGVLGYTPCFVIAKYPELDNFQHVYTIVYIDNKRFVFDTTIKDGKLNDEVEGMDVQEFCVFDERPETDGILSIARNFKYLAAQTLRNAKDVAPLLSSFLPFGIIGNSVASRLFSGVNNDASLNEIASGISSALSNLTIRLQQGVTTKADATQAARKIFSQFYTINQNKVDAGTYKYLERRLLKKIEYIDNYVEGNVVVSFGSDSNTKLYISIALVGLGAVYLMNKNKKGLI
jgi:hypothetical protein